MTKWTEPLVGMPLPPIEAWFKQQWVPRSYDEFQEMREAERIMQLRVVNESNLSLVPLNIRMKYKWAGLKYAGYYSWVDPCTLLIDVYANDVRDYSMMAYASENGPFTTIAEAIKATPIIQRIQVSITEEVATEIVPINMLHIKNIIYIL